MKISTKSIVKRRFQTTLKRIDDPALGASKKIHLLRTLSKQQRALLQLSKPYFKDRSIYKKEMTFYKDLSQNLTPFREAKVMEGTFEHLVKRYKLPLENFLEIQDALYKNTIRGSDHAIKEAKTKLLYARNRCEIYRFKLSCKDLISRLQKGDAKAYKSLKNALKSKNPEDFHTFRKYAKYHMIGLETVAKKATRLQKRVKKLENLTTYLGLFHDLTLFDHFLKTRPYLINNAQLSYYLHQEAQKMIQKASKLASKLFKRHLKIKDIC